MNFKYITYYPSEPILAAWKECLGDSDHGAHYTAPEFFLEPYFKGRQFAVIALEGDRVDGVITGIVESRLANCGLDVRPQVCLRRGCDQATVIKCLVEGLLAHLGGAVELITVFAWDRIPELKQLGFREKVHSGEGGVVVLDLAKGHDALFKEFSETRRNKIRRAMRAGVEVSELGTDEEFATYYDIYRDWCEFKNLPAQSREIQKAAFQLRDNRLILMAKHEGKVIGVSTFRFCPGGIVEYAANVSRREETKVRQNDLLLWKGIEWASQHGFRTFSMAGAHFFLQKFGGQIHSTYEYRLDRTFLRKHDLRNWATDLAGRVYMSLPKKMREAIKGILRRGGEAEP